MSVVATVPIADAQVVIDVNWNSQEDPTLEDNSFVPGDSKSHDIKVTNEGELQDLYFKIDEVNNGDFADELKFYLIDESSGKYFVGGSGDRFTVKELEDEGSVFVERLDAGQSNRYIVKVRFDKDAGNTFQGKETRFDMTLGFKGEPTTVDTPLPLRADQEEGGNEAPPGEVLGAETANDENAQESDLVLGVDGEVRGATDSRCEDAWPWWTWLLLLLAFLVLNVITIIRLHRRSAFVVITALFVTALFGWWFFDNCHTYWWSIIGAFITTIGGLLLRENNSEEEN